MAVPVEGVHHILEAMLKTLFGIPYPAVPAIIDLKQSL
jgi:hypothetical protein